MLRKPIRADMPHHSPKIRCEACRFTYGNLKRYYPMDDRRCLNCGAEVEPTLHPGLMSRFCDDKCKAAYLEKRRQEKKNGREQSRQTCPHCGKSYYPAWGQCARRFCCEDCRAAWWQAQAEPALEDTMDACLPILEGKQGVDHCLNCGAVVEQSDEGGRQRLFCCDKCRIAYHGRKHRENRRKEQRASQICPNCGKVFQSAREHGKHRRFCCDDCRLEYWREYHAAHPEPDREAWTCAHCGQAFDRKKSAGGKYCCRTCYLQAMAKTHSEGLCAWCGDWFPTYERLDRKYCSPRCAAAARHAPRGLPMKKSVVPAAVIPGSGVASPSLLAQILNNKYVLALLLNRQEEELNRLGIAVIVVVIHPVVNDGADLRMCLAMADVDLVFHMAEEALLPRVVPAVGLARHRFHVKKEKNFGGVQGLSERRIAGWAGHNYATLIMA